MWYIRDVSDRYCILNVEKLWEHTLCHSICNYCPLQNCYLLKHVFLSTHQIQSSEKKKIPLLFEAFNNFFPYLRVKC